MFSCSSSYARNGTISKGNGTTKLSRDGQQYKAKIRMRRNKIARMKINFAIV